MDCTDQYQEAPTRADLDLVVACGDGNLDKVRQLIEMEQADPCYQVTFCRLVSARFLILLGILAIATPSANEREIPLMLFIKKLCF